MQLTFVIILTAIMFVAQMILCFRAQKTWIKLIPAIAILVCQILCGIVYTQNWGPHGAAFAAAIYVVLLAIMLAVDGLAWLIWWVIQKVR